MGRAEHKDVQTMMAAISRGSVCQVLRIKDTTSLGDIFRKISRLWNDVDESKHMITYFLPHDKNMRVRLVEDADLECMLDVYRMMKLPLVPLKLEPIEQQSTDKGGACIPREISNDDISQGINSRSDAGSCPGSSTKKFPSRSARRRKAKRKWLQEYKRLGNLQLLLGNLQDAEGQSPEKDSLEDLRDHDEVDLDNEDTVEEMELEHAHLLLHDQSPEKDSKGDSHDHGESTERDPCNEGVRKEMEMEHAQLPKKAHILSRSARRKKAKRKWLREQKMLRLLQDAQSGSPQKDCNEESNIDTK